MDKLLNLEEDIKPLTDEDYKTNLEDLDKLKFKKIEIFDLKTDNIFKEVIGDKPKYVEFNEQPYLYENAFVKAINELYDMFKDCKSYEEARKVITTIDPLSLCSEDRGYVVRENTTGKLYCCWVVLWGDDLDKSICWDVRWY